MENTIVKINQEYLDTVARPENYWHYDSNEGINKGSWGDFWKVEMSLTNIITGEKMTNVINVLKDKTDVDDGYRVDKNIWYAVQEDSEDAWDYGSHNFDEAKLMLKDQGCGLIAVIENGDFCKDEIRYEDLF